MMKLNKGRLFIISGPSGAGKSTVLGMVFARLEKYYFSISMTTRAPRKGEIDGKDYIFTDKETFERTIAENGLLEYVQYVDKYYGTPIKPILDNIENGTDVFLDVEVVGRGNVLKRFPEAVSVFIMPPTIHELENRLRNRGSGESEETIMGRLKRAETEMALAGEYDYTVLNDNLDRAAEELFEIIKNEKQMRRGK